MEIKATLIRDELYKEIEERSDQKILNCYQCGKCSAGCPAVAFMSLPPHQVLRLLQIGSNEEVLRANSFWFCSSCFTCASRCPRSIDISKVMEALRFLLYRKGITPLSQDMLDEELEKDTPQQALVSLWKKST